MMRSSIPQLSLALLVAAVVHAGLFALFSASADRGNATALGSGGVTVSLGPSGRTPGGIPSEPIEVMPEVDAPKPVEAVTAIAQPERVEPAEPVETPIADRPIPEQDVVEVMEMVEAVQITAMVEATDPVEFAELVEPAEIARAVPMTPPLPPRQPTRSIVREVAAVAPSQPPGNAGRAGTGREADTGAGAALSGGGHVGALADYDALLVAWLERHKRYPRRAQLQRRQGVVLVRFIVDDAGRVVTYGMVESSGHDILDREGLETVRRASPMPTPPPDLAGGRLERIVPIAFSLR